jgi:ParB-like chromosome segregation protein Spo0J
MLRVDTVEQLRASLAGLKPEVVQGKNLVVSVPCMSTLLVRPCLVVANTYNPNAVPDDKLGLLRQSIVDNGFCFPIVTIWDPDLERLVIIDGFHRSLVGGAEWLGMEYLPVVVLAHDITRRMAATMQFNKARGVHQVDLDADLIRALLEQGLTEEQVAERIGLDLEAVHRYKQITGIAELFKNAEYSMAWEMEEET